MLEPVLARVYRTGRFHNITTPVANNRRMLLEHDDQAQYSREDEIPCRHPRIEYKLERKGSDDMARLRASNDDGSGRSLPRVNGEGIRVSGGRHALYQSRRRECKKALFDMMQVCAGEAGRTSNLRSTCTKLNDHYDGG